MNRVLDAFEVGAAALDGWLFMAATILIYVATVPAVIVTYRYWRYSEWRRYLVGRALLFLLTGITGLLVLSDLYWVLGEDYFGRGTVRFGIYAFISVGLFTALRELHRAQKDDNRDPFGDTSLAEDEPE